HQGAVIPGGGQKVHHRDSDRDAEAGFAVNRGLDVPGARHLGDALAHPLQIGVGSERADIEKLSIDRVRVAGGIGQRELDLFMPGFLSELRHNSEIDVTDRIVWQNQKVRRMKVRVENAEPKSIAQEVRDDVAAEDVRVETDAFELRQSLVII